jgi:hypothetical protein
MLVVICILLGCGSRSTARPTNPPVRPKAADQVQVPDLSVETPDDWQPYTHGDWQVDVPKDWKIRGAEGELARGFQWSADGLIEVSILTYPHDSAKEYAARSHGFSRCVVRSAPCWVTYYRVWSFGATIVVDDAPPNKGHVWVHCTDKHDKLGNASLCQTIVGTLRRKKGS